MTLSQPRAKSQEPGAAFQTPTAALGTLQLTLLQRLWQRGSGTVNELLSDWQGPAPAYVTILTVLRRLEKRGLVTHTDDGRAFRYRPAMGETQLKAAVLGDLASRLFGGLPELLTFAAAVLVNGDGGGQ